MLLKNRTLSRLGVTRTFLSWGMAALAFSCASCNSSSPIQHPNPQSSYHLPDQITLTVSVIRDADNGAVIEGTTNLPPGTKLGVELMARKKPIAQDFQVFVDTGKFRSAGFRRGSSPLLPGKQTVHIFTYFTSNWQSESVLRLLGKGGHNLALSPVIRLEDAQMLDSDKVLDLTLDLIMPPLIGAAANTEATTKADSALETKAIEMVKKAVLVVDGSRSSETVEGGVRFFFGSPGVRMGDGWSATPIGKDTYSVFLDFINTVGTKDQHDKAIWEVNLVTKKVLYRNQYAKGFSWIPKD